MWMVILVHLSLDCVYFLYFRLGRLWNDVFCASQDYIGLQRGSIRATCLIETVLAAFHMEEFIYQLKEHSAGLNCGRWDYIFSVIKKFGKFPNFVLPDRSQVAMTTPFMNAYVQLLIYTCHKRGVHAMGGMAAQIPIKADANLNAQAMQRVRDDKMREALAGHDGTWVAHPDLISIAKDIFDEYMPGPNQLVKDCHVGGGAVNVQPEDLLDVSVPGGTCTEAGLRGNISVSLAYLDAWLRGSGCIPINNLMEDAATAEISRSQIWQWLCHKTSIRSSSESRCLTKEWLVELIEEEAKKLSLKSTTAKEKLCQLVFLEDCPEFLTTFCYDDILSLSMAKL